MTLLAAVVVTPAAAEARTSCTPTLLSNPSGTTAVEVVGTDGNGAYAGVVADETGARHGVVWRDGAEELLDDDFIPTDINSDGLMSGSVFVPVDDPPFNDHYLASVRPLDGPVEHLTSGYYAVAQGLNDDGDTVGKVLPEHPVVYINAAWYAPERELSGMSGDDGLLPTEIDDTGLILGRRFGSIEGPHVIWATEGSAYTETILREYGPYQDGETAIDLVDLDAGEVAASRTDPDGTRVVVTIDGRTGGMAVVPGSTGGTPFEINNGIVVGSGPSGAMMWRAGEAVTLPAAPDTTTREASAVNETGTEIGGVSVRSDGTAVATVWTCPAG